MRNAGGTARSGNDQRKGRLGENNLNGIMQQRNFGIPEKKDGFRYKYGR